MKPSPGKKTEVLRTVRLISSWKQNFTSTITPLLAIQIFGGSSQKIIGWEVGSAHLLVIAAWKCGPACFGLCYCGVFPLFTVKKGCWSGIWAILCMAVCLSTVRHAKFWWNGHRCWWWRCPAADGTYIYYILIIWFWWKSGKEFQYY